MERTVHRLTLSLTKEDKSELEFLMRKFGESKNQVYRRALILLHTLTLQQEQRKDDVGHNNV
jgi:hypothetical protein